MCMSELAYDVNGDAFDVPDTVTGWRVKQLRARGAPELMYAPDGSPLKLHGEASLDELHDAVPVTAKYRLEPIGADGKPVENVPIAYIRVTKAPRNVANDQAPERSTSDVRVSGASGGLELAVLEAVRLNAEAMRYAAEVNATALRQNSEISMRALDKLDRMPDLMAAMATLLNVAAGTQLHALQQRELPPPQAHRNDAGGMPDGDAPDDASDDDDADETDETDEVSEDHGPASAVGAFFKAAGFDMNRFLNDVTSKGFSLIHGAARNVKLPSFGAIVDPQKAHAETQQGAAVGAHAAPSSLGVSPEAVTAHAPAVAPARATATRTPPAAVPTARAVATQVEAGVPTMSRPARTEPATITAPASSVEELLSNPNNARRFAAVRKALSAAEQTLVVQVIQAYDEQQVAAWLATLLTLRVPDAVAAVRAALARGQAAARAEEEERPRDVEPENDDSQPEDDDAEHAVNAPVHAENAAQGSKS